MRYTFKGKEIIIPPEYIARTRKSLGCGLQEAIDLYLSDAGFVEDPTVRELTDKAKGVRERTSSTKPRKAPTRKPDEFKRTVIKELDDFVREHMLADGVIDDVSVTNIERVIQFTKGDDVYEITLSRKRKPKS